MNCAEHSVDQVTQDSAQDSNQSAPGEVKVVQTLDKIYTDVQACGDRKLISDLTEFLSSRNYKFGSNKSATSQESYGLSNLQHAKVSSTFHDSALEVETVKPNSPVDTLSSIEYTLQEDRSNAGNSQQFLDPRTPIQPSLNIHNHDSNDWLIQHDQSLQEYDPPNAQLGNNCQDFQVVDNSCFKTQSNALGTLENCENLASDVEREESAMSDCGTKFDSDQCLQFLQSSCADDMILIDQVTSKEMPNGSLLIDPDEVMRHLNERDASFYDRVYISTNVSNSPKTSNLSQNLIQQIEDITLENETEAEVKDSNQCSLANSLIKSHMECSESSCHDENFPDSLSTNDCKIEGVKNSMDELCVGKECSAGHAFEDSDCEVIQSVPVIDNNESVEIMNSDDDPCNILSETICIANVTTNTMPTSSNDSEIVFTDLISEDDSLLKVELKNDQSESSSLVLNQKKKYGHQADQTNQFDSSNAGRRSKNSPDMPKSNTNENVIDKLHGLRWLKSPETSSDSDMARKKVKKRTSLPVELSSEENDKGNEASKCSKTDKTAQQNNSRRQSTPVPLQLTPNTEPLSVWSSTNAAQQLFPKPQTPPLEKLKEDEEYHLACAESMSTYEKEIELRKMAGVFPKTENLDKTNNDKSTLIHSSKILKDIPDYLRRESREGDSNNNESNTISETNKTINSDKRPVMGRGPKANQEFPSLPAKGNNTFKNKSNSSKKNQFDKQPSQDKNIQPNSASTVSLEDSAQSMSNLNQRTLDNSQIHPEIALSQNQDHSNSLDNHPYRNVSFNNTNGQCAQSQKTDNSGHHFSNPVTEGSKNQEQCGRKPSDDKNPHIDQREHGFSAHGNSAGQEYPRQIQRGQAYEEQGNRGKNASGHASDRYKNQNIKPKENHHENRTSSDQNREYHPRSRNDSENFDLPYMNQNLNAKNNYSNRNQAHNHRENDHPYRNQGRYDNHGSDRNRINNNHPNNCDNSDYPTKNQRYQTNRYQNSSHKSFDNRSQERSNPNHNYNYGHKPSQTWTPETRSQNNNPLEENWDEDIDTSRSQKNSISTTHQVSDRKIQSTSSPEHETLERFKKEPQSTSSQSGKTSFMPQESARSTKNYSVIDSSSQFKMNIPGEAESSEIPEISFGDCNTPPPQNRGVRADSIDASVPVVPQYLPPGLYQQVAVPRPGLSTNPLMLPGNAAMNVNPPPFDMVRSTQSLNIANPQLAAMRPSAVPINACLVPSSEIANPHVMNELSHNSQEIMRLHDKVNRLSKELQTTQAELLAAQAKSFHQVYVSNPALQNLVMSQDVVPPVGSKTPPTPSDSMPAKCTAVPPNLQGLSHNIQNVNPAVSIDPAMLTRLHLESLYMQHGNFHLTQSAAHFTNNADCNLNSSMVMGRTQPQNNEVRGIRGSNVKYDQ